LTPRNTPSWKKNREVGGERGKKNRRGGTRCIGIRTRALGMQSDRNSGFLDFVQKVGGNASYRRTAQHLLLTDQTGQRKRRHGRKNSNRTTEKTDSRGRCLVANCDRPFGARIQRESSHSDRKEPGNNNHAGRKFAWGPV